MKRKLEEDRSALVESGRPDSSPTKKKQKKGEKKKKRRESRPGVEDSRAAGRPSKKPKQDRKPQPAGEDHATLDGLGDSYLEGHAAADEPTTDDSVPAKINAPPQGGKQKKSQKKTQPRPSEANAAPPSPAKPGSREDEEAESNRAESSSPQPPAATRSSPPQSGRKKRYIVFVGNLPYSARASDVQAHFASVHPTSVRLIHDKHDPARSRGIAFVEFDRFDYMKTCLQTLHHSVFTVASSRPAEPSRSRGKRDNGKAAPEEERRINVELTAGGGGNKSHRRKKIQAKNSKLQEERARRAAHHKAEKAEKQKQKTEERTMDEMNDAVHPSRRGRLPNSSLQTVRPARRPMINCGP